MYIEKRTGLVFIQGFYFIFNQDFPSKLALQFAKWDLNLTNKENIVPEVEGV